MSGFSQLRLCVFGKKEREKESSKCLNSLISVDDLATPILIKAELSLDHWLTHFSLKDKNG